MSKTALIAFTHAGCELARKIAVSLAIESEEVGPEFVLYAPERLADELGIEPYFSLQGWAGERFADSDSIVFVGASGIAVRAIAPHVRDKFSDPAVVSVDERGRFAVPLLSGHVGGANDLARIIARTCGGQAAISTATDVNDLFAVDQWAREQGMHLVERVRAKEVSALLLEGGTVGFESDFGWEGELPRGFADHGEHGLGVAATCDANAQPFERTLHLIPRIVHAGIGCRRGITPEKIRACMDEALAEANVSEKALECIASIDVKADEEGLHEFAASLGLPLSFYSAEQLSQVEGEFSASSFVASKVGVDNVCERAAVMDGATLILPKHAKDGVTVALAMRDFTPSFEGNEKLAWG